MGEESTTSSAASGASGAASVTAMKDPSIGQGSSDASSTTATSNPSQGISESLNGDVNDDSKAATEVKPDRVEEQLQKAQDLKEEGNELFKQGKRKEAMAKWHHALLNASGINSLASQYGLPSTEDQNKRAKAVVAAVHNNLASCYLAEGKYEKILYSAGKVLAIDEKNVKAYYRRAKAYLALGENQKAAKDVDQAMELAPEDSAVRALARELVQVEEAKVAKQKKEMSGFLNSKSKAAAGVAKESEESKE